MDFAQVGVEMTREQEIISTKKRLETFQFRRTSGPKVPAPLSPVSSVSSVGRAHSRHGSRSSLSGSVSTSSFFTAPEQPSTPLPDSRPSSFVGRPRPNSHHHRRSSVSTRAESAEMMGISIPDLPLSSSDGNINFGDRDSVRRRALQALEGRRDLGCSNTVEIPDFTSQGIPQKPFDLKLPTNVPPFGISPFAGKRDSLGKFLSSSSSLKDQLHTLMEEEEEEEEQHENADAGCNAERNCEASSGREEKDARRDNNGHYASEASISEGIKSPETSITPPLSVANRHRPTNLTLRPLSLISSAASHPSLPTPSSTPSSRAGLRSFCLTPQPDLHLNNAPDNFDARRPGQLRKPISDVHSSSSSLSSSTSADLPSSSSGSSTSDNSKRQSSISYIRSGASQSQATAFTMSSLPTPGATPTSERRQSASSNSSFGSGNNLDRRNTSEDMFLHQSHCSLLARIAELEHALQLRSQSTPVLGAFDTSTAVTEAPRDEMLQLVTDLKVERDELTRDIDGWRQRVKDLEHSKSLLGHEKTVLERRLEAERREAWLKSEKLGLLEMEKSTLNRQINIKDEEISNLNQKLESTQAQLRQARLECESLREDAETAKRQLIEAQRLLEARKETEAELTRLREALTAKQLYETKLASPFDNTEPSDASKIADELVGRSTELARSNDQPRGNGYAFQSVDSACTTVDANEETRLALRAPFTLKALEEEAGNSDEFNEDELARYEDEDDLDEDIMSPVPSTSSRGSESDVPRSLSHLRLAANGTPVPFNGDNVRSTRSPSSTSSPTSSPCPTPIPLAAEVKDSGHASHASLSRTWTFPRGGQNLSPRPSAQEIDRFFGCLEDVEDSSAVECCTSMDDKKAFRQRLCYEESDDEDLPPFILPAQKVPADAGCTMLDVVLEEDEDEQQHLGPDERCKISFPVSVSEDSFTRMSSPLLDDNVNAKSVPFIFPQMKAQSKERSPTAPAPRCEVVDRSKPMTISARPSSISKMTSSPFVLPSRIPPPSPKFIQARVTAARSTPSPPSRKWPTTGSTSQGSPQRPKPLRVAVTPPRGSKAPSLSSSLHGPSFIPQLKVTSSSESQESTVGVVSSSATSVMKCGNDEFSTHQESKSVFARSAKPLLPALTNFFPLLSLSWGRNRPQDGVVVKRDPVYVPKERQLAKLRASMTTCRVFSGQYAEIARCSRCHGDLISL